MEVQVYSTIPLTRTSASTKGARIRSPDPVAKEGRGALPPVHSSSTLYTGAFSAFQQVVYLIFILYTILFVMTQRRRRRTLPVSHYATRDCFCRLRHLYPTIHPKLPFPCLQARKPSSHAAQSQLPPQQHETNQTVMHSLPF